MNRDIPDNVKIPRAVFVRFPYGAPLGPAKDGDTQMATVRAALDVLVSASEPGRVVETDIDWPE
jgi:hypothetical protein